MANDDHPAHYSLPEWDDWAQRAYVLEVARQCVFGIRAVVDLRLAPGNEGIGWSAWYAAQNFLTATANVSRLFWPSKPVTRKDQGRPDRDRDQLVERWGKSIRGPRLRAIFDMEDTSPLSQRSVRNAFEHIDNELDGYMVRHPRWTAEDFDAGRAVAPEGLRAPIRIVDPARVVISFEDGELDVLGVFRELKRLLETAERAEPLLVKAEPSFAAMLATLRPLPPEMRLNAPTRRPNEPVTAGMPLTTLPSLEEALESIIQLYRGERE